jgi:hypothetical protein
LLKRGALMEQALARHTQRSAQRIGVGEECQVFIHLALSRPTGRNWGVDGAVWGRGRRWLISRVWLADLAW